jgi:single-strand DNA-binding protein
VHEIWTAVVGNVVTEPRYFTTDSGVPMLKFRLANTPGSYENGQWIDKPTSYLTVTSFRGLAGNAASSLVKGEPIVAYGKLTVREYVAADGRTGVETQLEAHAMGHNLARGTTMFRRPVRPGPARPEAAPGGEPVAEGWVPAGPDFAGAEPEDDGGALFEEAEEMAGERVTAGAGAA